MLPWVHFLSIPIDRPGVAFRLVSPLISVSAVPHRGSDSGKRLVSCGVKRSGFVRDVPSATQLLFSQARRRRERKQGCAEMKRRRGHYPPLSMWHAAFPSCSPVSGEWVQNCQAVVESLKAPCIVLVCSMFCSLEEEAEEEQEEEGFKKVFTDKTSQRITSQNGIGQMQKLGPPLLI